MAEHNIRSKLLSQWRVIAFINSAYSQGSKPTRPCLHTRSVVKDGAKIPMNDEISSHLKNLRWVDAKTAEWSCIDGRGTEGELGTPGGDSGEFLLMLALLKDRVKPEDVQTLLDEFIVTTPNDKFYLHTDDHTLDHLRETLQAKYGKDLYGDNFDITLPDTPAHEEQILEELVKPENIGCGHIKLIAKMPADYELPIELTEAFIRAYFRGLWNDTANHNLNFHIHDFVTLYAGHTEKAVYNIKCKGLLPTIVPNPNDEKNTVFVLEGNHEVMEGVRGRLFNYFATKYPLTNVDLLELDRLASKHLGITADKLAKGLPTYDIKFTQFSLSQLVQDGSAPVDNDF
eukprot:gene2269-2571_t